MNKILAIIVTYYPEAVTFEQLLKCLLKQVTRIIVVDNTPGNENPLLASLLAENGTPENCQLVRLGENEGIARAINVGLDIAFASGADFVLLSDQDSLPEHDMVENLILAYSELLASGLRVAAVGPTFTDLNRTLTLPFQVQLPGHFFYGHRAPSAEEPHVEALGLITSGSLIPISAIRDVGLMREEYFIDKVDTEWCHRARARGYRLFGTGWARMHQRLGEGGLRVWYFGWREESVYSPLRIYYQLRNYVAICRLDYVDWRWKARIGWYTAGVFYSQIFFGRTRAKAFKMGLLGLWHGVVKKMGRYA
ncbi:glycosyltransferase family 2 protein [Dechloromonas sp. H13]|uniref:glycosyltransferase family 2 protein n=1 Tax=Dechloromonas sp. H13 TaxID=2570193 RepID=UPI001291CB64|nr:glycosyltransferase family 2 protein [Dechloromonas sp. H13]